MKRRLDCLIVAAAALAAACSEKTEAPAGAAEAPAAAAAPAASAVPAGGEPQGPAPGMWRIAVTTGGQAMPPAEICITEQMSMADGMKMQEEAGITCTDQSWGREGADVVGRSTCSMDLAGTATTITSEYRVKGDMNSAYTIETTSRMDPPPMPQLAEQKTTATAERLGDCAPG